MQQSTWDWSKLDSVDGEAAPRKRGWRGRRGSRLAVGAVGVAAGVALVVAACVPSAPPAQAPTSAPSKPVAAATQPAPAAQSAATAPAKAAAPAAESKPGEQGIEARKGIFAPWSPDKMGELRKQYGLVGPGPQGKMPEPRFPSYLKEPKTLEDLMPATRAAVTQSGGRVPLGLIKQGEVTVIATPWNSHPLVQEGIVLAFKERGVEARVLYEHDLAGVTKSDIETIKKSEDSFTARDGQQELRNWFFASIPDAAKARQWVRDRDAPLHDATWPKVAYPEERLDQISTNYSEMVNDGLVRYLDEHPEVSRVFWRQGGRPSTQKALKQHGTKFVGNYTYIDFYDIMSKVPEFPPDVWRLIEMKTIEPLGQVERVEVSDPEGTAFGYDLTPTESERWAKGVYLQGHLFMFPAQASGRYPYSRINFPALEEEYLMPVLPEVSGVIASTNNHVATHPRLEIHVKEGRIAEIKGGGLYGELWRHLLNYPGTQNLTWPFFPKPGYWWLYEAGTGTNPKYFKHPAEIIEGRNTSERNVGGVIHWSFGTEAEFGPEKVGEVSPETLKFAKDNVVPSRHCCHNHNLLPTLQVRLRGSSQWDSLINNGRMTAMDDPEARAVASRYGNPDEILVHDYIPPLPGITIPGTYDEYGRDPGGYWINWATSVLDGSHKYFKP